MKGRSFTATLMLFVFAAAILVFTPVVFGDHPWDRDVTNGGGTDTGLDSLYIPPDWTDDSDPWWWWYLTTSSFYFIGGDVGTESANDG
ncbi:MAG: hypothetical protein JSU65_00770 [Candidatus Zixiibacteriota bacterium]|nr:MAG: hypothetical protein JSU65_00770 [candidate division Zixibacteria bacterium]